MSAFLSHVKISQKCGDPKYTFSPESVLPKNILYLPTVRMSKSGIWTLIHYYCLTYMHSQLPTAPSGTGAQTQLSGQLEYALARVRPPPPPLHHSPPCAQATNTAWTLRPFLNSSLEEEGGYSPGKGCGSGGEKALLTPSLQAPGRVRSLAARQETAARHPL